MKTPPPWLCRALLPILAGAALGLVSCQQHTGSVAAGTAPPARPAQLSTAEPLRLGTVDFPTSGSPAAQSDFLHGVAALHSFWYEEALEAFARAAAIDPGFAMAYWGEAMCYHRSYRPGSDYEAGRRALAKIKDVKRLTPRERDYIAAARTLFGTRGAGDRAGYAEAMEKIHARYPDDNEATAFYALALLGNRGRGFAQQEKAGALAEEVYRRNPNHPGAAHYIIHCYDHPEHAPRALDAAHHYSKIAPDAPHALHMPSHIFVQLGMWREAESSNDLGWAASVDYVKRKQLTPTLRDYHNLHWLIYAALQEGRYAKARKLVDEFVQMRSRNELASYGARYINSALAAYVIETRQWDLANSLFHDGPAAPPSPARSGPKGPAIELCGGNAEPIGRLAPAGKAGGGTGPGTNTDTATFMRAFAAVMSGSAPPNGAARNFPKLRELQLNGLTQANANNLTAAIAALREAAAIEGKTPRPPGPPVEKPAHELLGEILLRAGDAHDAIKQFTIALERHPNRALSLLGRARAEAAAADLQGARETYARLLAIWQQADPDLPELREAREFVAAHRGLASR